MKHYEVAVCSNDPEMTLKIPANILRDLVLRSEENGNSIEVELSMRLARSLERDMAMINEDNETAYAAFQVVTQSDEVR
jgi:hypothetical protein